MSIRRRFSHTLFAFSIALACTHPALGDDDGLEPYRDRFGVGMEKYKAGAMAEAIRVWGAIYEEIGPHRGYRLAFNLARAHDRNGEATRAAERYTSFLDEVAKRVASGEVVDPLVEHEELEASDRIHELNRTHGRIQVAPGESTELGQVDNSDPRLGGFVAYVAPGTHIVTFGAGRADAEKVEVSVGLDELVVTHPTPRLPTPVAPPPVPIAPPVVRTVRETRHPFSPIVLYTGAGVTAVSVIAPAIAYPHANSLFDVYIHSTGANVGNAATAYTNARTTAYALLALPIGFAALTGGLTAWYFAGAKQHDIPLTVAVSPMRGGGGGAIVGTF